MQFEWRRNPLVGILLTVVSCAAVPALWAAAEDPKPHAFCLKTKDLVRRPYWASSAAWNGQDLVVNDAVDKALLRYSAEGKALAEAPGPSSKSWKNLHPVAVVLRDLDPAKRTDDRLVVQGEPTWFFVLDQNYRHETRLNAHTQRIQGRSVIDNIYTWAPVGHDIVAFADVKMLARTGQREDWATGIIRFALDSSRPVAGFQFVETLSFERSEAISEVPEAISGDYHRLLGGYSYITGIGNTAYYILMEDGFRLWKHTPELRDRKGNLVRKEVHEEMKALSTLFDPEKAAPRLPDFVTPESYIPLMKALERESVPTALYGWNGSLYLLSRHFQSGKTEWLLSRIDPKKDEIVAQTKVPSSANHLFAVPGPSHWSFIEKGPVLGLNTQRVESILTVQTAQLDRALSLAEKRGSSAPILKLCQLP